MEQFLHMARLEVASPSPCRGYLSQQPREGSSQGPLSTSSRAFRYSLHLQYCNATKDKLVGIIIFRIAVVGKADLRQGLCMTGRAYLSGQVVLL